MSRSKKLITLALGYDNSSDNEDVKINKKQQVFGPGYQKQRQETSQVSAPTRSTMLIRHIKEKIVYTEAEKHERSILSNSTTSCNDLEHCSEFTSSRSPFSTTVQGADEIYLANRFSNLGNEIALPLQKENWMRLPEIEKNRWITNYLKSTKNEVISVYRMIVDYRKGDVLQDELCNLSSTLSMIDIIPQGDRSKNTSIEEKSNYLTVAIQLKELQERYKENALELEKCKRQLNKDKRDTDTQTQGIPLEQLENSLKNVSTENTLLHSELDSSKLTIENLKCDLGLKNDELKTTSAQNLSLCSKVETLIKTIEDIENDNVEKKKKIENLFEVKNKFKYDFITISRERDEAVEEIIELKNKLEEVSKKLFAFKSKADENRIDFVHHSLKLSEKTDELNDKINKIKQMEEIISKHEKLIEELTQENLDQTHTIVTLETNAAELKSELKSWETRATCWINMHVRDEYQSKIEDLNKEIKMLKIKNKQLQDTHENSIAGKNEQIANIDKIVEMKQNIINQQKIVISLMRNLPKMTSGNEQSLQKKIDNVYFKYDEAIHEMRNSEELMRENGRLKVLVNELKHRLNSNVYNQLL